MLWRERRAGFGELQRADDATPVVRVHDTRGRGIELGEMRVRNVGAFVVVEPTPPVAFTRLRRRRQRQIGQRGAQIETRSADDDRRPAGREDLVDRSVSQRRVLPDRRLVVEAARSRRAAPVGPTGW